MNDQSFEIAPQFIRYETDGRILWVPIAEVESIQRVASGDFFLKLRGILQHIPLEKHSVNIARLNRASVPLCDMPEA